MSMKKALPQGKLIRIEDHARICMITNKAYAKDLPYVVKADGKTYYGCCDMCQSMLQNDPSKRVAIDPISGKKVDKSQAVIGAAANGGVVYFQSAADLEAYNKRFGDK